MQSHSEETSAHRRRPTTEIWRICLSAILLTAAAGAVYFNSLSTPFVFDDNPDVIENPSIRSLWPIWRPLMPSSTSPTVRRPIVNLSLAINHALGGTDVRGYHLGNLLIHFAAALTLFGIVRRTLARAWAPVWLRTAALPLGFITALLWALHPLQTESVTCVIQRTEALAGLVYLAALYCFVRGTEPAAEVPRRVSGAVQAARPLLDSRAGLAPGSSAGERAAFNTGNETIAPILLLIPRRKEQVVVWAGRYSPAGPRRFFARACFGGVFPLAVDHPPLMAGITPTPVTP